MKLATKPTRMTAAFLPAALAVFLAAGSATAGSPVISGVSAASVPRSDRVIITGSGFGTAQAGARVELDGVPIAFTRWSDTSISAYVLGQTPLGLHDLRIVNPGGTSDAVPLTVLPVAPGSGRVAWRFRADSLYFSHRPAVGSDGTVYAQDSRGFLYAIAPDGGLRWIYSAGGYPQGGGGEGPVALGSDGAIYVVGNPLGPDVQVHAVNPDGTRRWVFTDLGATQGVIAGPGVGPDGNIYFVTDFGGRGMTSISPAGQLLWSDQGNPQLSENGQTGAEIAFGAENPGGPIDQVYCAFDERTVAPTGLMYAFGLSGGQRFAANVGGDGNVGQFQPAAGLGGTLYLAGLSSTVGIRLRSYSPDDGSTRWSYPADTTPTNTMTQAIVGSDGTVYVGRNLGQIHAVRPDGTPRWVHTENLIYNGPVPSPANDAVVSGGMITYGQPGFVQALSAADGQSLWRIDIPQENGLNNVPDTRALFSPNGERVYIGTGILGIPSDGLEYCHLMAIDMGTPCYANCDNSATQPVLTANDFLCFINRFAAGAPYANCDQSTGTPSLTANDFVCFINTFSAGCP